MRCWQDGSTAVHIGYRSIDEARCYTPTYSTYSGIFIVLSVSRDLKDGPINDAAIEIDNQQAITDRRTRRDVLDR